MPEMVKKFVLLFSFLLTFVFVGLLFTRSVLATVQCETQYGGGQTCTTTQILVDKKVFDPDGKAFVDNLTLDNHHFQNGEEITFTVAIENTGDTTLTNVNFTDTLPAQLVWSGGDSLTSVIGSLAPGQTVTKTIKAKVSGATVLVCELNTALATSDQGNDSDMAQVCLGRGEVKAAAIPTTGPEMFAEFGLVLIGTGGYFLRKMKLRGGVKS